ncbi:DUF1707 domain-containing protein [Nocardioides sp. W7]|uniref:DUF1707 SHOCT-like domain-containing protein n=1 Tax=Nocardioides sp. W7 TaxID=2931390 RepID=UPI001FD58D7B|nr:DUF1707 domain-containing protein [Nocardioides sp. W7]
MSTSDDVFWRGFRHDPRQREHAGLRTSDADRELVLGLFVEAYAEGRIGVDDLESRAAALTSASTLAELLGLLADLVPAAEPTRAPDAPSGALDVRVARELAVAGVRRQLVGDLAIFVVPGAACVLLWWLAGSGFFWPVWVLVYTGIPPVLTLGSARSRIAERERELVQARLPDLAA